MNIDIQLRSTPLSLEECRSFVAASGNGAIVLFEGTVRDKTSGKRVTGLDFEAYGEMALKEMQKIASTAIEKFPISSIAIHHRKGPLVIGETPVIIAVSAPHRRSAFEACIYAIDTLKETVPIWKKEYFEDGSVWVAAHP